MLTLAEGLRIHAAVHDPQVTQVIIAGKQWPLVVREIKGVKIRECTVFGYKFSEQNVTKPSPWTAKAKKGAKITWVCKDTQQQQEQQEWGRIVNGKIEKTCDAFDDNIVRTAKDGELEPAIPPKTNTNKKSTKGKNNNDNSSDMEVIKTEEETEEDEPPSKRRKLESRSDSDLSITEVTAQTLTPTTILQNTIPTNTNTTTTTTTSALNNSSSTATSSVTSKYVGNPSLTTGTGSSSIPGISSSLLQWQIDFNELEFGTKLGAGAFGMVCEGGWRGTPVAIKMLHSQDDKALTMFVKEAELMCKLRHPNIVQCLGACITPPNCSIVMELLPSNLSKLIKKQGKITNLSSESNIAQLFFKISLGIARGLNFLHKCNPQIIHRDLKPANILLDSTLEPRIADFGVSREKTAKTATMTKIGTPTYCAPEVLNNEYYNSAVDIYSFGMLMYAVINGGAPWKDETLTPLQIMMKVAVKQERPPLPPDLPQSFTQLLEQCWKHNPKERPDAGAIVNSLKAIQSSGSTTNNYSGGASLNNNTNVLCADDLHTVATLVTQQTPQKDTTMKTCVDPIEPTQVIPNTSANASTNASAKATTIFVPIAKSTSKGKIKTSDSEEDENLPKNNTTKNTNKPICMYDIACYRTNPNHFLEFAHPGKEAVTEYERKLLEIFSSLPGNSKKKVLPEHIKADLKTYRKAHPLITKEEHEKLCKKVGLKEQ